MENFLIIPTAKLIEDDLRGIFGEIPPILLPVNEKETLLSKIVKNFQDYKIVILANEKFDMIENSSKDHSNVDVFNVGETKSIKETLLAIVKSDINMNDPKNVSILFGDTLIDELDLKKYININSISYSAISKEWDSKKWTFLEINQDGSLGSVIDKKDKNHIGNKVFNGFFNLTNFDAFKNSLLNNETFYDAILEYDKNNKFSLFFEESWKDFGHLKNYFKNKIIQPRYFNEISLNDDKTILTKKSTRTEDFEKEINWFTNIPKKLTKYIPEIYESSINESFVKMEYVKFPTLSQLLTHGNLSRVDWEIVIDALLGVKNEFNSHYIKVNDKNETLRDIYVTKTLNRLGELDEGEFSGFFKEYIQINNMKLISIPKIIKLLPNVVEKYLINDSNDLHVIHGDFFFANILFDLPNKKTFLVDPRGSFGDYDIYGDYRYDLAKLSHSVRGKYDLIINDFFEINKISDDNINFVFTNKFEIAEVIKDILNNKLESYNKEILLIESLLFLSMVPLHSDYYDRQVAMLVTGIVLFNEFIERWKYD